MNDPKRRYFICDGDAVEEPLTLFQIDLENHRARSSKLLADLGGHYLMERRGLPIGILLPEDSETPLGFKLEDRHAHNGATYKEFRPVRNTKLGRDIVAKMEAVGEMDASKWFFGYFRMPVNMIIHGGYSYSGSAGCDFEKRRIYLQIPVTQNHEDYEVHASLREIKKSQFIAYTEEGE